MKKLYSGVLIILILTSCRTISNQEIPKKPIILAHYLGWFGHYVEDGKVVFDHWQYKQKGPAHDPEERKPDNRKLRDIASVYYPRIGVYDSLDPDVIDYHILTAKAAGVEGFVVDWYGYGDRTDSCLKLLFKRAKNLDFLIAVCFEEKICFPDYYHASDRNMAVNMAADNIRYLAQNYFLCPEYLRYNDKPCLFVFSGYERFAGLGQNSFSSSEWQHTMTETVNFYLISQKFLPQLNQNAALFSWIQTGKPDYAESFHHNADYMLKNKLIDFYVSSVSPGFNDSGVWGWGKGPRIEACIGTEYISRNWNILKAAEPKFFRL